MSSDRTSLIAPDKVLRDRLKCEHALDVPWQELERRGPLPEMKDRCLIAAKPEKKMPPDVISGRLLAESSSVFHFLLDSAMQSGTPRPWVIVLPESWFEVHLMTQCLKIGESEARLMLLEALNDSRQSGTQVRVVEFLAHIASEYEVTGATYFAMPCLHSENM